jgi:hypothetical protein
MNAAGCTGPWPPRWLEDCYCGWITEVSTSHKGRVNNNLVSGEPGALHVILLTNIEISDFFGHAHQTNSCYLIFLEKLISWVEDCFHEKSIFNLVIMATTACIQFFVVINSSAVPLSRRPSGKACEIANAACGLLKICFISTGFRG